MRHAHDPERVVQGFAPVEGAELYYEIEGHGRTLVLIHGGLMDHRMWEGQLDPFAGHLRVVRYDVRGYGRSGKVTGAYSHIEDLRRLLDHLGIEKTCLLGLSMGGEIAINFALEHADRVEALIAVGAAVTGFPVKLDDAFVAQFDAVLRAVREEEPERAVEELLRMPYFVPAQAGTHIQEAMKPMLRDNLGVWAAPPAKAVWPEPPAYARIESIGVPTLIMVGADDVSAIQEVADDLMTRVRGACKAVIPGAGHHANMEQPEAFNKAVIDFLVGD